MVRSALLVAASCLATGASAGIIDFEQIESPIVVDGQRTALGEYNIDSYGENAPGSLVGTMGNNDICTGFGIACPKNNLTNYYNVLGDSYFVLSKAKHLAVRSPDLAGRQPQRPYSRVGAHRRAHYSAGGNHQRQGQRRQAWQARRSPASTHRSP